MVAFALGNLLVKLRAVGIMKVTKQLGRFQEQFGRLQKKMRPALSALQKGWMQMGAVAGLMLWRLTEASPRLRAQMELLNLQTNKLLREFGDELAPVIGMVVDGVRGLYDWFKSLPQPMQDAITFGGALAVAVGILAGAFAALSLAASPVTLSILAIAAAGATLYYMFQTNFGGFRDTVMSVYAKIKPLFESIQNLISMLGIISGEASGQLGDAFKFIEDIASGVFTLIGDEIKQWIDIFQNVIDFITNIFTGDFEGALGNIRNIVETIFGDMGKFMMMPLDFLWDLIEGVQSGDILGAFADAGRKLIESFLSAAAEAIEDAGELVRDVLEWLGEFFGGSLPERGPLKNIDRMGRDLGAAYVTSIGSGMGGTNITRTINRNFRIATVNVLAQETDFATTQKFGERLRFGSDVRRSTGW